MTFRLTTTAKGLLTLVLLGLASTAQAACTKPVGRFVGSGSGFNVVTTLSAGTPVMAYQGGAISLTVNILSDGSVSAYEEGKLYPSGFYSQSWTVKASDNTFSTASCLGTIIDSLGRTYTYTSSGSGTAITFIDTGGSGLAIYNIRLDKG